MEQIVLQLHPLLMRKQQVTDPTQEGALVFGREGRG